MGVTPGSLARRPHDSIVDVTSFNIEMELMTLPFRLEATPRGWRLVVTADHEPDHHRQPGPGAELLDLQGISSERAAVAACFAWIRTGVFYAPDPAEAARLGETVKLVVSQPRNRIAQLQLALRIEANVTPEHENHAWLSSIISLSKRGRELTARELDFLVREAREISHYLRTGEL